MSGIAAAVIGGVAVVGGAVIASQAARSGANAQADAARDAANATANATAESVAESRRQYDLARADMTPWRESGVNALAKLVNKVNAGPGDYTKSEGYDFRLSEGNKAIERSAAARGSVLSGGTLKALTRFGQEYATSDYDNFLRRYYESLNPLQSLAGVGQSSSAQTASLGAQSAANIANTTMAGASGVSNALLQGGQAQAAGAINQANIYTGATNSIASLVNKVNENAGMANYLKLKYGN